MKIAENGVMQDEDASYVVYTAFFLKTCNLTLFKKHTMVVKQIPFCFLSFFWFFVDIFDKEQTEEQEHKKPEMEARTGAS